ncbi:transcriptional repressor TCF25-domain-containing protein [Podospora didyma]|uniref:Transcriptional repressor TCF25-domain-containing protein n=1 Tax=Podospora didyma TaxID=330526 RepID=A0AAE0NU14_9PEZI|nr:transcriptional repressor TCF25-domain-containing protein [Podospora didyma]
MASRQMRKLRKQQEDLLTLQNEAAVAPAAEDESEDEPDPPKPRANVFSGFAALGDMGGDDDDDDHDTEEDETQPQQTQMKPPGDQGDEAAPAKKVKKPKKKKKKGKKADASAPQVQDGHDSMDEIDRVLEELRLEKPGPAGASVASSSAQASAAQVSDLLSINFQNLKAMNEMRKMFGKVMETADAAENPEENRPRGNPRDGVDLETYLAAHPTRPGQTSKTSMFDTVLRTNPFIDGKKTWPRDSAHGLKMTRLTDGSGDGVVEFTFAHDKNYDALEASFFGLVQMYDPMQIVHFLHRNPYHVSSLIQVSKVARQDQNSALAADLIERAVFSFGRISLSDFRKKLEQGRVKMDFNRPENRQFYLAGHNLIQKLIVKGTFRTALEWAKLFLGLNHEDPYSMVTWIHVLAIRAYEAQWFVDLCHSKLFDEPETLYPRQTLALAYLQLKDRDAAKATLIEGIEQLPWLYCALFSSLNLDTAKSIWGVKPRDKEEELHTKLYIHSTKDLWGGPDAVSLLLEAAAAAQKVKDISSLPQGPPVSLGTARFVYLDNNPELMSAVPRQLLHQNPNFDFDPLPPPKDDNVFSSPTQSRPWTAAADDDNHMRARLPGDLRAVIARALRDTPPDHELQGQLRDLARQAQLMEEQGLLPHAEDLDQAATALEELGVRDVDADERLQGVEGQGFMQRFFDTYLPQFTLGAQDEDDENDEDLPSGMPGEWGEDDMWDEEADDFEGEDDFDGGR